MASEQDWGHSMNAQHERRSAAAVDDDVLPAELVALLVMCGAEVRAADRELAGVAGDPDAPDRRVPERRRAGDRAARYGG